MTSTSAPQTPSVADIPTGAWHLDPERSSIELTIDAGSLDTKQAKRDAHLRAAAFFDVEEHPQVRFVSDTAVLDGDTLKVRGQLHAAGRQVPLLVDAKLQVVDGGLEIEASTEVDHRQLGILRSPSTLLVRGRLIGE